MAGQSLFVASAAQAFIHLDGPEMNEERLKAKLIWMGEQNAFAGWGEMMIDHRPSGEDARPLTMTQDRWKMFASDAGSSKFYQRVKFTTPPGDTLSAGLTCCRSGSLLLRGCFLLGRRLLLRGRLLLGCCLDGLGLLAEDRVPP